MLGCQLGQPREVAAVVLRVLGERWHGRQAGDRRGAARDELTQLPGRHALLALLPRHVDLDQHLARRGALQLAQHGLRGHRVDEAHRGRDVLDLAALQLADEVPGEQAGVGLLLGRELLGPVLAHQLDARLGQRGQLGGVHVLDRRQHLHARPPPPRTRSSSPHPLEVEPGDAPALTPSATPCPPGGRSPRRRGGGRRRGPRGSACTGPRAPRTPRRRPEPGRSHAPQVQHPPVAASGEVGERLQHLGPHLEAALPDPGPDHRGGGLRERRHASGPGCRQATPRQPQCTIATCSPSASATGRQSATSTSRPGQAPRSRGRPPRPAPRPPG